MDELLASLASTNVWAVLGGIFALIVGSSALTMWIQKGFDSRQERKRFKRDVRSAAVDTVMMAYVNYLEFQQSSDPQLAIKNATTQSKVHGEIAKVGSTKLLSTARQFTQVADRYAANDPLTSIEDYDQAYDSLLDKIVKSTPA